MPNLYFTVKNFPRFVSEIFTLLPIRDTHLSNVTRKCICSLLWFIYPQYPFTNQYLWYYQLPLPVKNEFLWQLILYTTSLISPTSQITRAAFLFKTILILWTISFRKKEKFLHLSKASFLTLVWNTLSSTQGFWFCSIPSSDSSDIAHFWLCVTAISPSWSLLLEPLDPFSDTQGSRSSQWVFTTGEFFYLTSYSLLKLSYSSSPLNHHEN